MTLSEIQQSFYSRSFEIGEVSTWLWGLAGIISLILAYLAYKYIQARRMRYSPFGSIAEVKTIRNILRSALDQRRPFEVQVQMEAEQRRPTLRCSLEYVAQDAITLEINGLKTLSGKWISRPIAVFFRIQIGKEFVYYTFASHIEAIKQPRQDVCHIILPIPAVLENRQKRSFLRIMPPKDFFPGAAMWCGEAVPPPDKIQDISLWPRPKLLYIPDRMEQFHLLDLSAGGARIRITGEIVRSFQLQFNSAQHLVLMLDLFDPEQSKRLRFWLECRIQNVWVEHATRDVHLGVQFLAWARPKESADTKGQAGGIEWLRLSASNEVEPIGNWIMRRHLELFRENPFDVA